MDFTDVADEWFRWGLRGFDGLCGRIDNHAKARRLTEEERRMMEHVIRRLQQTLIDDALRGGDGA